MIISIAPAGRLANRMIAFLFARSLAWKLNVRATINCDLQEWNHYFDWHLHDALAAPGRNTLVLKDRDVISMQDVCTRIRAGRFEAVILDGFFQRIHLFYTPARYREFFPVTARDNSPIGSHEIAIHVRAGDILTGVRWYPLVPVPFYRALIRRTGLKPVFLGQTEDSGYLRAIREAFPDARIAEPGSPVADFNLLRSATNLCISVSTFSWLAAWLSDAAEIHYPLLGFLHPGCFPYGEHGLGGIDLTPTDDARYRFYLFPVIQGSPEADYLRFTQSIDPVAKQIPPTVLKRIQSAAGSNPAFELNEPFDEAWYLRTYLDAAWEISEGWYANAMAHYAQIGRQRDYLSHPRVFRPATANVALHKPADQSSISPWSIGSTTAADAARAVDGNAEKDMAFHTALDDHPWWTVDLGHLHAIECIHIFNRRSDSADVRARAVPLGIDLSDDGRSWRRVAVLATGLDSGAGQALPLQWVAGPGERARRVKLVLLKRDFLHLAEVEVYGTPMSEDSADAVQVSHSRPP